jgi:hypothetical protein
VLRKLRNPQAFSRFNGIFSARHAPFGPTSDPSERALPNRGDLANPRPAAPQPRQARPLIL